jgi:hypothetical protein
MYYSINASLMFEQVGASGILDTDTTFKEALAATTKASHFDGVTGTAIDTTQPIVVVVTAIWGSASASNVARTLVGSLRRL